jgi:formylglycine-generating enzyme required for sulfatase activity
MHGNVWERCQDVWDKNYYAASPPDDPGGPPGSTGRVVRGGGCGQPAGCCRSAYRNSSAPGWRSGDLGFRVSQVLAEK